MTRFQLTTPTKILSILLFVTCITVAMPPTVTLAQQKPQTTYTVKTGDTLSSISRQFGVSVEQLKQWNNLTGNEISIGQQLVIKKQPEEKPQPGATIYRVKAGDTLFSIARQYGVTVAELKRWNDLRGNSLEVGQQLRIKLSGQRKSGNKTVRQPARPDTVQSILASADQPGRKTYTVKSGDSLYRIAREHGMTVAELKSLNNLNTNNIYIGQRLVVKSGSRTPSIAKGGDNSAPQGKFISYKVKRGETLNKLLRKFNMDETELKALNPEANVSRLVSGQTITVLMPPSKTFANPYRVNANMEQVGEVPVQRYPTSDKGTVTTSGDLYNPDELTAAHNSLALGSIIFIENPYNHKGIFVRINDRTSDKGLKLSDRAYQALKYQADQKPVVNIYQQQ